MARMAAMVDQVTSGGIERSMGDMLLEQVAEAEKNYREELEIMVANLSRLSGELRALVQEPRGDREGARRPSERDRRDREKDQRKANGHRHAERPNQGAQPGLRHPDEAPDGAACRVDQDHQERRRQDRALKPARLTPTPPPSATLSGAPA